MRTPNVGARAIVAIVGAALLLLTVIAPVSAAERGGIVSIDATGYFDRDFHEGPFTASGSGICHKGTQQDIDGSFVWYDTGSDRYLHIQLDMNLTCDDHSGTFQLRRQIYIDTVADKEVFTWVVIGGTGGYARLRGGGYGVTEKLLDRVTGEQIGATGHMQGIVFH